MIERKLTGAALTKPLPKGTIDTQMHLYAPGFGPADGCSMPPEPLPDAACYKQVRDWLGIDRFVITQGNSHGRNNENLLACLREVGPIARGVAAICGGTSEAEIARLTEGGVVGARIMDLPGGAVGFDEVAAVDAQCRNADWALVVQMDGGRLSERLPTLEALKSNWVLDHHGKFFDGASQVEIDAVLRLIDRGNCYFKFAACYESAQEAWPYEDIAQVARRVAEYAPDRVIWGTNWPHNQAKTTAGYPDDGALADLVLGWLPEAAREQVLVTNPARLYRFAGHYRFD
jgi:D-galactarolactone isomerase